MAEDRTNPENSFWSIAIEYQPTEESGEADGKWEGKSKIDYREVLSPEDFSIFAKLREWRKEVSHQVGVPLYSIFTNEQLAKIAENRVASKSGLQEIDGVGKARVNKYCEGPGMTFTFFVEEGKYDCSNGTLRHFRCGYSCNFLGFGSER